MLGLMQNWGLTVDRILEHANTWHGDVQVASRSAEGSIVRTSYSEIYGRAKQVSSALRALGVGIGDRVATLAWNTPRHLECWYGIMGIGAVCHTLNPRFDADQLCYVVNDAQDRVVFADAAFLPVLLEHRARMPSVEHVVVLTDEAGMGGAHAPGVVCFETLIAQQPKECLWGGFDENTAAGLCYTSGTTGHPKGVLYAHRSNFLLTYVALGADCLGLSATDVVLPLVPMFHANGWTIIFSAPAVGAKLVLPADKLDGASIHELLETERVTISAAVPTVWQLLLNHLRETKGALTTLKRIATGGSALPEAILRAFQDDYGIEVRHAWGMTETSSLGTVGGPSSAVAALPADEQVRYSLKQGRVPLGVEMKLTDEEGRRLPRDGATFGKLKVKGPFVARRYFNREGEDILDDEGFFDTGDIATIDARGYMQITDRAKDVIKSGGEWISSIEIENVAMGHPKTALCAVIAAAHPKWDERPLLLVKLKPGEQGTKQEFVDYLKGKIPKWWTPDDVVFLEEIPLGSTGKVDKKRLRERMKGYVLPGAAATVTG